MSETTISVRIGESMRNQMKLHEEINWSSVLRNSVAEKLEELASIDFKRAEEATKLLTEVRKSKVFDKGKSSEEIIREWREKRK